MNLGIPIGVTMRQRVGSGASPFSMSFTGETFDETLATFSRDSAAAREQVSGQTEQIWYAPRFEYTSGSLKGLLYEPAGTNQFPNSEALAGNLTAVNATLTANQAAAPDGTMTASRLQLQSNGYALRSISGSWNSQTHSEAVWVKTSSGTATFKLRLTHAGVADYDSAAQTATTTWQRFSFSQAFGATAGSGASVGFFHNGVAADIYIWGLDVRKNSATIDSYIANNNVDLGTRAADAITFTIPSGGSSITYTFDDNSTQVVSVSPGAYTVPTNLNRRWIKSIVGNWTVNPSAQPSTYTGPVATRTVFPDEADSVNKQMNCRTWHRATERLTSFQIIWPTWYANSTGLEQTVTLGATFTASVEYPAGTFTQVTFGGSASTTLVADNDKTSDTISLTIPKGAVFWIRSFYSSASNIIYSALQTDTARGEACNRAASGLSDLTMGGTITDNASTAIFKPIAIVATTRKPTVALVGDSRVRGSWDRASGDRGELAGKIGKQFGYLNLGKGNEQATTYVSSHSRRLPYALMCSHVILQHGINDHYYGRTEGQLRTDLGTILGYFTGHPAFIATMSPSNDSSDNWTTLNNQTTRSYESDRVTNNTWRRGPPAGFVACFDIANELESSANSGKWKVDGTASKYTTDGGHATAFGEGVVSASNAIDLSLITR